MSYGEIDQSWRTYSLRDIILKKRFTQQASTAQDVATRLIFILLTSFKSFAISNTFEMIVSIFSLQSQLPGLSIVFPVVIFGVVATLAGILMYWIPETLFSPMHQTIEEAEAAEDDYGIPYCGKRIELRRRKKANDVEVVWL